MLEPLILHESTASRESGTFELVGGPYARGEIDGTTFEEVLTQLMAPEKRNTLGYQL